LRATDDSLVADTGRTVWIFGNSLGSADGMASDKLQTCAPAVESNCHFDHHLSYSDVKQRTDGMSGKHCIKDASSVSEQNDLSSA